MERKCKWGQEMEDRIMLDQEVMAVELDEIFHKEEEQADDESED